MPDWKNFFQNELVQLQCYVDDPEWQFVWYRNDVQLQKNDNVEMAEYDPFLNITAAKEHQGEYSCSLTVNSRALSSLRSNREIIIVYGKPLLISIVFLTLVILKRIPVGKTSTIVSKANKYIF